MTDHSRAVQAPKKRNWLEGASQWQIEQWGDHGIVQITPNRDDYERDQDDVNE